MNKSAAPPADARLPPLICALLQPQRYGHATSPRIELVETHISYLLLTGRYAYKIKKPLNLGFLDFGTLEKRRFYCEEELRLNRRLAPSVYLEVAAITGTPEQPEWNGAGPAIEYAVRMLQFPQEMLLDRLLAQGKLQPAQIDELAQAIAVFHRRIAVAPETGSFGNPDQVRQPVMQNFEQIASLLSGAEDLARLQDLRAWSEGEYAAREPDLLQRKRAGFIRECHGDLHLGNIVLLDGVPTAFDCIEFSESLRWIDVMSEIAFLVMDLHDRNRPDLAQRALNAWLEAGGDYAGLALLRYYLVYRALVRAKVAAIRGAQDDPGAAEKEKILGECRGYLDLAQRLSRAPRPLLVITHGVSGSGKSTLTQPLLEQTGAIRIRSDVERKRLFGLPADARTGAGVAAGIYGAEANRLTYRRLAQLARAVAGAGYPVIVDAAFLKRSERDEFRQLAQELAVPFVILDCHADEAELRRRVAAREREGRDASEAGIAVLEHQLATREPLAGEERASVLAADDAAATGALRCKISR